MDQWLLIARPLAGERKKERDRDRDTHTHTHEQEGNIGPQMPASQRGRRTDIYRVG